MMQNKDHTRQNQHHNRTNRSSQNQIINFLRKKIRHFKTDREGNIKDQLVKP